MSLQEFQLYLSITKDIFTIIASAVAGVVAVIGLQTWRKQLKGKTEYELAQKLLIAIYRVRDAIYHVRNPLMSAGEISKAMKDENIEGSPSDPKVNAASTQAVYQQRWGKLQESLTNMDVAILEAEALWGKDVIELSTLINKHVITLRVNILKYLRSLQNPREIDYQKMEEIEEIIYGFSNDEVNNKFSAEILECIKRFEKFLKPRLIT